ncbi:MAG: Dinucleotide-utilizing enzyme [Thermoanaerobacterales bacterium 50_218]|nr:MAG: Dinucleotide-utilizing enzyme [Thermoanaerobacterales bacterium 50_218]HAA89642.1 adenylyltransferase [Peptococcaceae bacterium]
MEGLSDLQKARYERNILLKEIGEEGQQKLLNSSVLVVGVGGVGSPVAYYLAAAGVGRIGLIDPDHVSLSNLQRQILHSTADIRKKKVESAKEKLQNLNPEITIETFCQRFGRENAKQLVKDYDVVVDCADGLEPKYLLNDVCLELKKPFIYAGVRGFTGQLTTFLPGEGPCFRCLFPSNAVSVFIDAAEFGVLGVVPGVIGCLQATEAIKILLGIGSLLTGRLLIFNALAMSFSEIPFQKNPDCSSCR